VDPHGNPRIPRLDHRPVEALHRSRHNPQSEIRNQIGTVRYPRIVPNDEECAHELNKRTLTNLYNERPTWIDLAHKKLDAAVFAAYGWEPNLSDDDLLAELLALNLKRAAAQQAS
jgi:hypothetical protein